jgi:hypothetical protein
MAGPEGEHTPQAVRWAVLAMYGGAALTVAWTATVLASWYFQDYLPASSPTFTHSDSGLSVSSSPLFAWLDGFVGLLICCLWLWTARMCARGRGWARVTAAVLFAVPALAIALRADGNPAPQITLPDLLFDAGLLVGLAAVVLLWHRSSGPYFGAGAPSR